MKLIDADALRECFHIDEHCEKCRYIKEGCDNYSHMYTLHDVCCMIDEVDVVDAIPVEWIKNRLAAMLKGTASAESCFAVQVMLVDWQKEQEAR